MVALTVTVLAFVLFYTSLSNLHVDTRPSLTPTDTDSSITTLTNLPRSPAIVTVQTLFQAVTPQCNSSTLQANCSHLPMLNSVWHIARGNSSKNTLIFGAYFDKRENNPKFSVRIFGVSTVNSEQVVFCQLWYNGVNLPFVIKANLQDTGRGYTYLGVRFQERLYTCELPVKLTVPPVNVSLTFSKCATASNLIPVVSPSTDNPVEVGLCVVVAYGTLDPVSLVEWIEYQKLLGVGEINIYDSSLEKPARDIFNHYEKLGIVNIKKAAPPMINYCKWCQKLAVIPALNDCMYRNMFRYKHTMVIDFDEFIIPRWASNLSSLLSTLRSTWNAEPPGYMFRNAYFFKEFPSNKSQPGYLLTSQYLNRAEPSKQSYAPKSIVNPRRCLVMQNHFCMVRTCDVPAQYALNVKPEIALSHHYKNCHFSKTECLAMIKNPHYDISALRFQKQLNTSVYEKLQELKLFKHL